MAEKGLSCKIFPPGSHSLKARDADAGANQCALCTVSTATPNEGTVAYCPACPDGKYSDVKGASDCKVCPAGTRTVDRTSPELGNRKLNSGTRR